MNAVAKNSRCGSHVLSGLLPRNTAGFIAVSGKKASKPQIGPLRVLGPEKSVSLGNGTYWGCAVVPEFSSSTRRLKRSARTFSCSML
jgi:hypothetical protein